MAVVNSPNMSLPVPIVGQELGPQWATDLNACLAILDQHNHTVGSGVQITPAGLNITTDLPIQNNNLTQIRTARFQAQTSVPSLAADIGCLSVSGVDLYYNDVNGTQIRLTQAGGIVGSPGSISGLVSPASATYVSADQTFVWQSAANTPANVDAGSVILRNAVANSKGLTLQAPPAMGADYSLVLPTLPAQTNIMTLDASGNMAASFHVDNSTLEVSGSSLRVKAAGITGAQVASNINLPGNSVQENGKNVVVSNTNAGTSLSIVRGVVDVLGNIVSGEGFAMAATAYADGISIVVFSTAFADIPAVAITCGPPPAGVGTAAAYYPTLQTTSTSGFTFIIGDSGGGTSADTGFSFVAVGAR